jgi:hypothetical protein
MFWVASLSYFFFSTISSDHLFNEGYVVYFQEAWNISHHLSLWQLGVIQYDDPNFTAPNQVPLTYPIGTPILFVVLALFFGYNPHTLKIL